ncbi:MAG TPA: hypothetical protein VGC42_27525 [Kofleriaceae bacterium]
MIALPLSAPRRAWNGACRAVIPAYGVGAMLGLASGTPIILAAGAGAIAGMLLGATLGLVRAPG